MKSGSQMKVACEVPHSEENSLREEPLVRPTNDTSNDTVTTHDTIPLAQQSQLTIQLTTTNDTTPARHTTHQRSPM